MAGNRPTIRGATRPVTLQAEYIGHVVDPWGGQRAVFAAEGTLNREDWGLDLQQILRKSEADLRQPGRTASRGRPYHKYKHGGRRFQTT